MVLNRFKDNPDDGIDSLFVEIPDDAKDDLIFKWPNQQLRRGAQILVDADYRAVITNLGKVVSILEPGRHTVKEGSLPIIGGVVDWLTDDRFHDTELFYISTREFVGIPFGGVIDTLRDQPSSVVVELRTFGNFAIKVTDPVALLLGLTGTVNIDDRDSVWEFISTLTLRSVRTVVTARVESGDTVLALAADTHEIETAVIADANIQLQAYGLQLIRFGVLNVNLSADDAARIKQLSDAHAYVQLAGSWESYTRGQALLGLGQGAGDGGDGGSMIAGLFAAGMLGNMNAPQPAAAAPQPAAATVTGSKFCSNCGTALGADAKFCSNCGTAVS